MIPPLSFVKRDDDIHGYSMLWVASEYTYEISPSALYNLRFDSCLSFFLVGNCRCDKDSDGRITGEEVKEVRMLAILNPFFFFNLLFFFTFFLTLE